MEDEGSIAAIGLDEAIHTARSLRRFKSDPVPDRCEEEVRSLVGLPGDFDTFAMMPIGWPVDSFGPLTRRPLSDVVHVDTWGRPWPQ